eukprot:229331_1
MPKSSQLVGFFAGSQVDREKSELSKLKVARLADRTDGDQDPNCTIQTFLIFHFPADRPRIDLEDTLITLFTPKRVRATAFRELSACALNCGRASDARGLCVRYLFEIAKQDESYTQKILDIFARVLDLAKPDIYDSKEKCHAHLNLNAEIVNHIKKMADSFEFPSA